VNPVDPYYTDIKLVPKDERAATIAHYQGRGYTIISDEPFTPTKDVITFRWPQDKINFSKFMQDTGMTAQRKK